MTEQLNPDNRDFTFRNLDLNKSGAANLSDPFYEAAYAMHFDLGVQRELAATWFCRPTSPGDGSFTRFLSGIDYNRFNRQPQGPVIPRCMGSQSADLTAMCSTGQITFDNTSGIAKYHGLLVRLEKRFSRRTAVSGFLCAGQLSGKQRPGVARQRIQ